MLIWHKINAEGRYNMRTNAVLAQDFEHLKTIIERGHSLRRVPRGEISINDMSSIPGNKGLWRVTNKDGDIIGEAYDPDIYRVRLRNKGEAVIPAYEKFFDKNGKFSEELFKLHYKKVD